MLYIELFAKSVGLGLKVLLKDNSSGDPRSFFFFSKSIEIKIEDFQCQVFNNQHKTNPIFEELPCSIVSWLRITNKFAHFLEGLSVELMSKIKIKRLQLF